MLAPRLSLLMTVLIPLAATSASAQVLANGGFETGYTGWTLSSGDGVDGLWVSLETGDAIDSNQVDLMDQADNVAGAAFCIGVFDELPLTASEGTGLALNLHTVNSVHRMYQDVDLPGDALTLSWDMSYENSAGVFTVGSQEITVNVRNADNDEIIGQLYASTEGVDADEVLELTAYSADLSAYAGQRVRLDVTHYADDDCFPLFLDNFQVVRSCGDGEIQGTDECDDGLDGSATCTAECTLIPAPEDDVTPPSPTDPAGPADDSTSSSGCQANGSGSGWFALLALVAVVATTRRKRIANH